MIATRALVERVERVEAAVVANDLRRRGDGEVEHRHGGVLAVVGQTYSRAHAITLQELDETDAEAVRTWFEERGADPLVQLSSFAGPDTVAALASVGAVPAWARAVHVRPLDVPVDRGAPVDVTVTPVDAADLDTFLETLLTSMRGESDTSSAADRRRAARELADPTLGQWLARVDGVPAGAGIASVVDGVAFMGPAGTLSGHRRRGVHRALLEERLVAARSWDADVAVVTTHADTISGRNAERCGFRLLEHQWVVRLGGGGA